MLLSKWCTCGLGSRGRSRSRTWLVHALTGSVKICFGSEAVAGSVSRSAAAKHVDQLTGTNAATHHVPCDMQSNFHRHIVLPRRGPTFMTGNSGSEPHAVSPELETRIRPRKAPASAFIYQMLQRWWRCSRRKEALSTVRGCAVDCDDCSTAYTGSSHVDSCACHAQCYALLPGTIALSCQATAPYTGTV